MLCIGLDPDLSRIPEVCKQSSQPIFEFNNAIIDATLDLTSCYKPQIAHYASEAAEDELLATIEYLKNLSVPVLLDAKRGDVGSTAEMYARELFERYGADATTVNPYLGKDSMDSSVPQPAAQPSSPPGDSRFLSDLTQLEGGVHDAFSDAESDNEDASVISTSSI